MNTLDDKSMDTYLIYGTKRGGHHAILQWIAKNLDRRVHFYNDCRERLFVKNVMNYRGKFKKVIYNKELSNPCKMFNFENGNLDRYEQVLKTQFVGNHIKTIITIRDIFNIIASTIKSTPEKLLERGIRSRIKHWKEYCEEMLEKTNYLKSQNIVFVSYNDWFISREYRDIKAKEIGFINKDHGIKEVTPYGGGSSFDGNAYQGNANQMKVLTRYEDYLQDNRYLSLFTPEIQRLNKKIFGFDLKDLQNGNNIINNNSQ